MKSFIKTYWKTLLFFTIMGIIGGFSTGLYLLDSYPADIQQQIITEISELGLNQIPVNVAVGIITAIQSASYGLIFGAIGIALGKKIGLWKDERKIEKKSLIITIFIAIFGGLMMILPDILFFGRYSEAIMSSYETKPTLMYMIACMTYGGVIEEILARLFTMSLIALIFHRIFSKKPKEKPSSTTLHTANIFSEILFAAGHLPATFVMLGSSPLIIFRCFLLNGLIGASLGYLYRKHGLRYSMIAHAGCHAVSKLFWILLI